MSNPRPSGTKEWARETHDICRGCPNDCAFCYSKAKFCYRFKMVKPEEWKNMKVLPKKVGKTWKTFQHGQLMFPANHDITPENINESVAFLKHAVEKWESVLIVTKPRKDCVVRLCEELKAYKNTVLFRFTIGSHDSETLKFWEPGAPDFSERLFCLQHAFNNGFRTSVSSEPTLNRQIGFLIEFLLPYITNAIWVGPMNKMESRVRFRNIPFRSVRDKKKHIVLRGSEDQPELWTSEEWRYFNEAKAVRDPEFLKSLYSKYKDNPRVKWKNEAKSILGLSLADDIGLDV